MPGPPGPGRDFVPLTDVLRAVGVQRLHDARACNDADMSNKYSIPASLPRLLESVTTADQPPVRFRPGSWRTTLPEVDPQVLGVLTDSTITWPSETEGDSVVDRNAIHDLLDRTDPDHETDLLRAFLLVQAWGAGTTGSRTLRHTARAFDHRERLVSELRSAISTLRGSGDPAVLVDAYGNWKCPGVGPSFFTKWFAFAGRRAGRSWQPLILDDRVYRSLNRSLDVRLVDLAGSRARSARYRSYVEAVHAWGHELGVSAERIEYVLFRDNGIAGQAPGS